MNKKLHFAPELINMVLTGKKTVTFRLWDDKNLTKGDLLEFLESGTEKHFATAKITEVVEKELGKLTEKDRKGHEDFANKEEMYKTYYKYYKKKVHSKTLVKVVRFELISP